MKTLEIQGKKRNDISKQEVKALRVNDMVPCVLYGGTEVVHFSADTPSFKKLVYTPDVHLVKLNIDGQIFEAIVQDIQYHPVSDAIVHVDFLQAFPDKPVVMSIPVRVTGNSEGVKMGGKLVTKYRRLKVKGLSSALPDEVVVDITPMKIGNNVRVRDLKVDGVTFLDSPANVVVAILMSRNVTAAAEETPAKK